MYYLASALVNSPLVFLSLLVNLFFIYCLFCPSGPEKVKQPLKLLLHTLVWCTVIYLTSLLGKSFSNLSSDSSTMTMFFLLALSSVSTSMTASAWLIFYYHTRVVPAKRALSVWAKKNIRIIIYTAWIFERLWTLSDLSFVIINVDPLMSLNMSVYGSRSTLSAVRRSMRAFFTIASLLKIYFFLSMILMVWSCVSISCYLIRHIQRMRARGEPYSSPKFYSQLKVAVCGIVQGFLYVLSVLWVVYKFIYDHTHDSIIDPDIHFTVVNFYMFGTTVNLWAGQTAFREKAEDVVRALKNMAKSLTPQLH